MKISPALILIGIFGAYWMSDVSRKKALLGGSTISSSNKTGQNLKFPGYEIKDQILIITDAKKAKQFVFDTGKNNPEGALFKLAFGSDQVTYSDVKKVDYYATNLIVKDKDQQDGVYILLCYLFTGAYQTKSNRVGHYADIINSFTVFLKNMFDVDYPIIKSVDDAKEFFEGLAKTL